MPDEAPVTILLPDPQCPERRAEPADGALLVLVEDRHAVPAAGLDVTVSSVEFRRAG
jgi:hypothetical protein